MFRIIVALVLTSSLSACVTTAEKRALERTYCERMEREMGVNHTHDHAEAKGMGVNPMNVTHARCREMLKMN